MSTTETAPKDPPVPSSTSPTHQRQRPLLRCKCKLFRGTPCHTQFETCEIEDTQEQFLSLSQDRDEFDIALLAKIECGIHMDDTLRSTKKAPTQSKVKRQKVRLNYFHKGRAVCREFFLHLHVMGKDKLDALIKHYKLNGIETRVHKNSK